MQTVSQISPNEGTKPRIMLSGICYLTEKPDSYVAGDIKESQSPEERHLPDAAPVSVPGMPASFSHLIFPLSPPLSLSAFLLLNIRLLSRHTLHYTHNRCRLL